MVLQRVLYLEREEHGGEADGAAVVGAVEPQDVQGQGGHEDERVGDEPREEDEGEEGLLLVGFGWVLWVWLWPCG